MISEEMVFSHYKILEKLGGGGMGVVYKAEDTKLHRIVALKFLPPELTRDEEAKLRFIQEAEAASSLDHNNICVVHEIDETRNGQIFICMNYYEGETLKKKLEKGSLSPIETSGIALQIAEGLQKAHEKGIIHRDIKPANIFITNDGIVKILDFGLAKLSGHTGVTRIGSTLGTAAYMSPEQARGDEMDQKTDIWSLGVVLYEMITGKAPFKSGYEQAIIYSILNEEPDPISTQQAGVSDNLRHLIIQMLEKDKGKRCKSIEEVILKLQEEIVVKKSAARGNTKRMKLIIPAILVVIAFLSIIYIYLIRQTGDETINSVAVLPFVDMSQLKDQEYFCDGMTEALINRLSNVSELRVPARTSAFYFKDKQVNIQEVGDKLNVKTVLEGSVQKSGERLRITAQLINTANGYQIWSEKYDRKVKDVFTIQDEISSAIINALRLKLTSREKQKITEHPINIVKAYEYYLKAGKQILRFDEKSLDSALAYLETARDIMGDNALLYAGMSSVYVQYANIGIQQEDYIQKAEEYALKALTLNPDLSYAYSELAYLSIYKDYPQNLVESFRNYKKAFRADSNEVRPLQGLAHLYEIIGDPSQANDYLAKLERKDPLSPRYYIYKGYYLLYSCRFEQALKQFRQLYEIDPTSLLAQTSYSNALAYNGRQKEAITIIDNINTDRKNIMSVFSLILKYALLKEKLNALQMITPDVWKTCRRDYEWSYWLANGLSLAGANQEALDWLENAVRRGFINYPFMQCDPFLNNIRGEKKFSSIMEYAKHEWESFKVPE